MAYGLFIAGTDTGVGKTIVTASLGLTLKAQRYRVVAMKPIETGVDGDPMPDSLYLNTLLGLKESTETLCPYRFSRPLAPAIAARMEGRQLEPVTIQRAYDALRSSYDIVLVEGVGGLLVPLAQGFFVIDLIALLNLNVLLVARRGLGTINHTLLSLEALKARGLFCLGVVLNDTEGRGGIADKTNPMALKELMEVPLVGVFPFLPEKERLDPSCLYRAANESLDTQAVLSALLR